VIDLHCHILPGIDDGPEAIDGSLLLAAAQVADGVEVVAATPHLREDHPTVRAEELAGRCADTEAALRADGSALSVVPAAEVDLALSLELPDEELRLGTYGQRGTDVLVETPYGPLTASFEQLLFDRFMAKGLRVLLAHPERSPTFQENPARLADLVRKGVLTQVTAASLARGDKRSRSGKAAHALVKEGLAHVIASDSHGAHIDRAPLSAGVAAANRIAPGWGDWMTTDAPAAILAGERLPDPPPLERRRGLFRRR
jgi:protein-tyrosine phosphatase